MEVTLIYDKENRIITSELLHATIENLFAGRNIILTFFEISKDEIAPCVGCFGCWVKTPGECVIQDKMAEINRKIMNSDMVLFITPVIFGQYSYAMKNVVDRTLGRCLPFFVKFNGRTVHPLRYDKTPTQYVIGCIEKDGKEDAQLFLETHKKYRRDVKKAFVCDAEDRFPALVQEILTEVQQNEKN